LVAAPNTNPKRAIEAKAFTLPNAI
jgi:hypothetical protein